MFDAASLTEIYALFIGLYMLAAGIGLLLNPKLYSGAIEAFLEAPMLTYLAAMMAFVIGALIVATHNDWNGPLAAIVSLIGWAALIEGILMLALPRWFLNLFRGLTQNTRLLRGFASLTLTLGAVLLVSALV